MVRNQQAAALATRHLRPPDPDADVEYGQQLSAPGFHDAALPGLIKVRVDDCQSHTVNQMQGYPASAEYT
jgi:hypothetical protein